MFVVKRDGLEVDGSTWVCFEDIGVFFGFEEASRGPGDASRLLSALSGTLAVCTALMDLGFLLALLIAEDVPSAVLAVASLFVCEVLTTVLTDATSCTLGQLYVRSQRIRRVSFLLPIYDVLLVKDTLQAVCSEEDPEQPRYGWCEYFALRHCCAVVTLRGLLSLPVAVLQVLTLGLPIGSVLAGCHLLLLLVVGCCETVSRSSSQGAPLRKSPFLNVFQMPRGSSSASYCAVLASIAYVVVASCGLAFLKR